MFNNIKRDDKIFQSDSYQKDSLAFCIMESIRLNAQKHPTPKIFSNGNDCIIINSDPKQSVIAWTADDFKAKDELFEFIF